MRLESHEDKAVFSLLREEWNRLLEESACNTLFLTWEWQRVWWEYLGEGPLTLLTLRQGERLVGLAPFYLTEGRDLRLVGGMEVSDYLDIIALRGQEREIWGAILDHLREEYPGRRLDLHNLPATSPTLELLPSLAVERGLAVEAEVEGVCPLMTLPESWEGYLQRLDRKERHELRRKVRRAQMEARVEWHTVDDGAVLSQEMEIFLELHRKSSPEKRRFMAPPMRRFFLAMAEAIFRAGWLRLGFVIINGEKVASLLCFDYGDSILLYNSGYDPERYSALSPGLLATAYAIEEAIREAKKVFDFLRGDEDYKYRFGARDTKIYHLSLTLPD